MQEKLRYHLLSPLASPWPFAFQVRCLRASWARVTLIFAVTGPLTCLLKPAGKTCAAGANCTPNVLVPSLRCGRPGPRAGPRAKSPALCRRRGALWLPALLCAGCQAGSAWLFELGRKSLKVSALLSSELSGQSYGVQARIKIAQVRLVTSGYLVRGGRVLLVISANLAPRIVCPCFKDIGDCAPTH